MKKTLRVTNEFKRRVIATRRLHSKPTKPKLLTSFSFSGAGFLGSYHAGVYQCLLKHNHLLKPLETLEPDAKSPVLTGVSAGALISAAISAGVEPESAMNVILEVAKRTREKGGLLDTLAPNFSLIDQLDDLLEIEMQKALGGSESENDYDLDLLLNRIQHGKLLHIGLTDKKRFDVLNLKTDLDAYVYADQYRSIKDITSCAVLSSYIPVGTGPAIWNDANSENNAVKNAWKIVSEMEELGFLKHGLTKEIIRRDVISDDETLEKDLQYLDGGLCNLFPEIDEDTIIIAPINGLYSKPCITPEIPMDDDEKTLYSSILSRIKLDFPITLEMSEGIRVGANSQNLLALYQMARSSSSETLQGKFRDGYDDAVRFLKKNDMLTVFSG